MTMDIELIEQTELTPDQRAILAEDGKRWKRMGAGQHLDDWLAYGPGMRIRRTVAMRIAYTNQPTGRAYNEAMTALMERDGLHTMDKTSLTAVLWLHDNPQHMSTLNEIRDTMTAGQRSRLNSPISARQRVEKVLKARAGDTEESTRGSPVANLKSRLVEKERENSHLQDKLAAAEQRDGSLFDLKRDTIPDIAATIVATVTHARAKNIASTVLELLKQSKPAG